MKLISHNHGFGAAAISLAASALLSVSCSLQPPLKNLEDKIIEVKGGGVELKLHSLSARITSIVHTASGEELLRPWPDQDRLAWFSTSITDGLTGRTVSSLTDSVLVLGFEDGEDKVEFDKLILPDGYRVAQRVIGTREGVFLDYEVRPDDEDAPLRSLDFTVMLPIQRGSTVWVPGCETRCETVGRRRRRFVYGPGAGDDCRMRIPLISLWRHDGPAITVAVPLELPVVRVVFEVEPSLVPGGVAPRIDECDWLRVTFDLAGASGTRSLRTGLWLYAHEPGWRDALRVYAEKYREYFEAPRRIASAETPLSSMAPELPPVWRLTRDQNSGVRTVRLAWNVFRSGEWVPPQALRFDDFSWRSEPDSAYGEISVSRVRGVIDNLIQYKISAVLDGAWNSYCERFIAESSYGSDIAENEEGEPISAGPGRLMMHAGAESPFGRAMMEQQRQMLDLYPQALGYYFADWSTTGIDFAHDDSLTVVHNRPASDLAANRVRVGEKLIELVSQQRKLTIISPPSRVVEAKGVDMICFTGVDPADLRGAALLGLWRPVISDPGVAGDDLTLVELEELLKEKLVQGVIASHGELERDQQLGRAYRPLFAQLTGRQWRLDPVGLELPSGVRSQLFQVPSARVSGEFELVLCLVQPGVAITEEIRSASFTVALSFPGADRFNRASWQAASRAPRAVPLRVSSPAENRIEIVVPPFGPAGVLRLDIQ
ncbi:MAG: hypothetical protein FVQ81_09035 [Candidatus Glassbacteria bacterium]|nr:hypothetical protein [Candidatus Glassbacteria bacterium]